MKKRGKVPPGLKGDGNKVPRRVERWYVGRLLLDVAPGNFTKCLKT